MKINRYLILVLTLLILITTSASAQFSLNDFNFDISPDSLTKETYFPLDELKKRFDFRTIELGDGVLIDYRNNYYLLYFMKNKVESSRGIFNLDNPPLKINGHILVPGELIISNFDLQTEAEQQYKSDLKANLYLDDRRLTSGAKLGLTVEIINSSSIKQSLRFNSSQIYNIIIKDKNDQVVYSWAEDKLFAQSFRDIEIEAKEALYFEEKILLPELSRGDYYIMVEIKSIEKEISSKSKKLIID